MAKTNSTINEKALAKIIKKAEAVYIYREGFEVCISDGHFIAEFRPEPGGVMDALIYSLFGVLQDGDAKRRDNHGNITDFDGAKNFPDMIGDAVLARASDTRLTAEVSGGRTVRLFECDGYVAVNADFVNIADLSRADIYLADHSTKFARPLVLIGDKGGFPEALYILPVNCSDAPWNEYLAQQLAATKKSA